MADGSQSLDESHGPPPALRWAVGVVFSAAASMFVALSLLFLYRVAGWEILVVIGVFGTVLTVLGLAAGRLKSRAEVRVAHRTSEEEPVASPVVIEVPEGTKVDFSPEKGKLTISTGPRFLPRSAVWTVVGVGVALSIVALSVWAARSTSFDPGAIAALGASLAVVPVLLRPVFAAIRDWLHIRAAESMYSEMREKKEWTTVDRATIVLHQTLELHQRRPGDRVKGPRRRQRGDRVQPPSQQPRQEPDDTSPSSEERQGENK